MGEPFYPQQIQPTGKITREQLAAMSLAHFGKKHKVHALIERMEPGEILNVSRADFQWRKHTPMIFCLRIMRSTNKKFSMLKKTDRTGWVVIREA